VTSKDLVAELERQPFVPLRIHLVSGKTIRVTSPNAAFLLQNALMLIKGKKSGKAMVDGYDVIALRNIERVESVTRNGAHN
jgi:hypothetical protein